MNELNNNHQRDKGVLTQEQAILLCDAHEIYSLLQDEQEIGLLSENNPELLSAYYTLYGIAVGKKKNVTIECYYKQCRFHSHHIDDGPFCDEDKCQATYHELQLLSIIRQYENRELKNRYIQSELLS